MKQTTPQPILLKDYKVSTHRIDQVDLTFTLDPTKTLVRSEMQVKRNPASKEKDAPLVLHGEEMELLSVAIDGQPLSPDNYTLDEKSLTLAVPDSCTLTIENEINPEANTALDGLYASGKILCTQCEPHGFRRITYFIDRPDNMSTYRVKLIGDKKHYPVMLSNGNCIGEGDLPDGTHWAQWEDPFRKPSYLFAIVAGDLGSISDTYTTGSGRTIDLRVYCDKGNEKRCEHALDSLKKSMVWDEEVFGLEYDLDLFMIVAVDAFNFGAMENKGLNIFNTSAALADSKTETDDNFARVEAVVAHEYFHNWTGNRVTCRDWFQLTLKEGLTVFRDQEFSSDLNCRPVERIDNVNVVRNSQFTEDAGPMAHPIKPESYIQINNFYTSTVYRKGSEVIRMIHTLIGKEAFRRGIDKYFELFDGQAVTTEDFLHSMSEASGFDFSQFRRWYSQAGTPRVVVSWEYDAAEQTFTLELEQSCAPTADGSPKEPFFFPFTVGLVGPDGKDLPATLEEGTLVRKEGESFILQVANQKERFVWSGVKSRPVCSVNRDFTAPIKVETPHTEEESVFLMAHDPDAFNRWDAGRELGITLLLRAAASGDEKLNEGYSKAFAHLLQDQEIEPALKALALSLPSEATLGQRQDPITFTANRSAREAWMQQLAQEHKELLLEQYHANQVSGPYRFDPECVGRRKVANICLAYLSRLEEQEMIALCHTQYQKADNMTDALAPMQLLCQIDCPEREEVLRDFYGTWKEDPLVMCKWFGVQAASRLPNTLERVQTLTKDPAYSTKIPNLIRALWGTFLANEALFHSADGSGYEALADVIIELDPHNPMIAAGLSQAFRRFRQLDEQRQQLAKKQLERIVATEDLSTNTYEIVSKTLESAAREEVSLS